MIGWARVGVWVRGEWGCEGVTELAEATMTLGTRLEETAKWGKV